MSREAGWGVWGVGVMGFYVLVWVRVGRRGREGGEVEGDF